MIKIPVHNLPAEIGAEELLELIKQFIEALKAENERLEQKISELEGLTSMSK
jgi:hypothetical protein